MGQTKSPPRLIRCKGYVKLSIILVSDSFLREQNIPNKVWKGYGNNVK